MMPVRPLFFSLLLWLAALPGWAAEDPILIGFDAEEGVRNSTSQLAIRTGLQIAIDEINHRGGVLGGRPLQLLEKANRGVPARSVENLRQFADDRRVVAVFGGRFSPAVLESAVVANARGIPLLVPWAAADSITSNPAEPSYTFRLSLRDSWAMPHMLDALHAAGVRSVGVLLPSTGWGRSNEHALDVALAGRPDMKLSGTRWYNWGDRTLITPYLQLLDLGAEALLYVGNDREGSVLLNEVATLPSAQQLPIVSHWGVTGGEFFQLTAGRPANYDLRVVQTFSFLQQPLRESARRVAAEAVRRLGLSVPDQLPSPIGIAHAYDLMHILGRALDLARSTDRARVRAALEEVRDYQGLIKDYAQPFSADRHEALAPDDLFLARYRADGALVPAAAGGSAR